MLLTDWVHLTDSSCFIHGPFTFDSHTDIMSAKKIIALQHWEFLLTTCIELGIVSPTYTKQKNDKIEVTCVQLYLKYSYTLFLVLSLVVIPVLSLVFRAKFLWVSIIPNLIPSISPDLSQAISLEYHRVKSRRV